jgi:hypothetical protein
VLFRHRVRAAEGPAMNQQPDKRIPQWLTIDVLIIVIGMMIIGLGMWLAPW